MGGNGGLLEVEVGPLDLQPQQVAQPLVLPAGCLPLPADGEGLGQQVVQLLAARQPLLELRRLGLELGVGEGLVGLLQRLYLSHQGLEGPDLLLGGGAENLA